MNQRIWARANILILIYFFLSFSSDGAAIVTVQRQISQGITWSSCNVHGICYTLVANNVELGLFSDYYYIGTALLKIQKRSPQGELVLLVSLEAAEGKWNYIKNQWILLIPQNNQLEFLFTPATISEKDLKRWL